MQALVVDDSRATRLILGQLLRQVGFDVAEAGDGREGLSQLRRLGSVDLVLVDWNMPDMNGLDFVRAVRADPGRAGVRLLMVTSEEERRLVDTALEAGANAYLPKPFTREAILEKLHQLGLTPR